MSGDGWFFEFNENPSTDPSTPGPSGAEPGAETDGRVRYGVVEDLAAMPVPGSVYTRAVTAAARTAISGSTDAAALPDRALRVSQHTLDQAQLDAYAHLIGETAGEVAPAGFVHVSVFGLQLALMASNDFPLPMLGMVHVANRIEQLRPVRVGEDLSVLTWARSLTGRMPHPESSRDSGGTQVELVTQVSSGSETVWEGVSTYLAKKVDVPGVPVLPFKDRAEAILPVPTGGWSTSKLTSREYAAVSGDRNPIHTSALAAKAFGFPRQIAHGMDTAARAFAALGPKRHDAFTWSVEFASPVLVPGRVALAVERRDDVEPSEQASRGGYALTVWDPKSGRVHLTSTLAQA